MKINELRPRNDLNSSSTIRTYDRFAELLKDLRVRDLSPGTIKYINEELEELNNSTFQHTQFKKLIKNKEQRILEMTRKQENLFPSNYFQNHWMALGMVVIGLPLGLSFGLALGNIAFLGIGLPIGLAIGMSLGTEKDKKVKEENRQLNYKQEF